jgi:hypothetical protein
MPTSTVKSRTPVYEVTRVRHQVHLYVITTDVIKVYPTELDSPWFLPRRAIVELDRSSKALEVMLAGRTRLPAEGGKPVRDGKDWHARHYSQAELVDPAQVVRGAIEAAKAEIRKEEAK